MTDLWIERQTEWHLARMVRLGASVEELANETIESILGFEGKGGHKPPRADIQKYKDADALFQRKEHRWDTDSAELHDRYQMAQREAADEWAERYGLDDKEISAVSLYKHVLTNRSGDFYNDPQKAFDFVAGIWGNINDITGREPHSPETLTETLGELPLGAAEEHNYREPTAEGKKFVGNALKKYEQQNYPMLYGAITDMLADAYRRGPMESYKLWPRMVTWLKDYYQDWLLKGNSIFNRPNQQPGPLRAQMGHILDIGLEGGKVLDQLRRENTLPQGFDVNKVPFDEFEEWLMQWKRDNRESLAQGEVVYTYHDDWTMQKLTTPEQLQYEGDEMGHCVGGYAHQVGEGSDIIYSLRDPKDNPHVTIEIRALEGPANLDGGDGSDVPEDAYVNHEYIHPDKHAPGEHLEDVHHPSSNLNSYRPTGETAFEVIQVQGNSNKTPKSEYQHKVKEFLDSLRAKGWKFVRSENWFHNFDDPRQEEYGDGSPSTARELDEWYDDHYKGQHEQYQNGKEDPYGMQTERAKVGVSDWEEMFKDVLHSLIEEYDRGKWTGNWKDLAQAVYHAWAIDIYKDHLNPEELEKHKKSLLSELEGAEETLSEWEIQNTDSYYQHAEGDADRLEHFETILQANGKWDAFNEKVDEQVMDEDGYETNGEREAAMTELAESPEYEEEWMEANDKVHDEIQEHFSGDARRFCQYVYMLAEKHGMLNPGDLPNPNDKHGGLPSFEQLGEMPWKPEGQTPQVPGTVEQGLPGAMSHWVESAQHPIEIHPIDAEHNVWFDTDGNQRQRFRPGWARNPTSGRMEQTGELEDTFLDKHGRQGYGYVAYNDDVPVGSLTAVDDQGWHMIGTAYTHPDFREQGVFSQLAAPLRATGRPIDAYVWENPWLKNKVRGWTLENQKREQAS